MAYTTIDNPELHFQVYTYAGNASNPRTHTLSGDEDMQPDMIFQKNRSSSNGWTVADAVRGANLTLSCDGAGAEITDKADGHVDSFTSTGFVLGAGTSDARINDSGNNYIAWCWKANGSGSSNTTGTINTTATSANTTSGFSINTYTGNSTSGETIGHGLGVKPAMIFCKNRDASQDWLGYHESFGATKHIKLNQTEALGTATTRWNDVEPTTSVFTVGNDPQTNGSAAMVAYCFANVQGYSKMGGYTGNGNANGAFVYTGFRPACLLLKRTSGVRKWFIFNNKIQGFNPDNDPLFPNASDAEGGQAYVDLLSNGFKFYDDNDDINGSGSTYIYAAFAEAPFVNSNGVPCNAR